MPRHRLSFIILTLISLIFSIYLSLLPMPATAQRSLQEQERYGQQLYQAQQYEQAVQVWQEVVATYEAQGDRFSQARVSSNLALAHQQLGRWTEAQQMIANSLALLQKETPSDAYRSVLAQTLNNQGFLQLARGETEAALATWEKASQIYQQIGDRQGFLRSQINKAQALGRLGLYPRACQVMAQALTLEPLTCKTAVTETSETLDGQRQVLAATLNTLPSTLDSLQLTGWQTLGETLRAIGKPADAQLVFQDLLQRGEGDEGKATLLLSLGKTAQSQGNDLEALDWYQQAARTARTIPTQLQSQLAQLKVLTTDSEPEKAIPLISDIKANLQKLPPNYDRISAQINFIASLTLLKKSHPTLPLPAWTEMVNILTDARELARNLASQRLESYALGNLGAIYEQTQQWPTAQQLTEQALLLAQATNAPEIAYRWQWQLGRLLQAQDRREQALVAYTAAVETLESIKNDLVAVNQEIQFSFRQEVEPVYRELVSLLLQSDSGGTIPQDNLLKARDAIESLQLAELDNFLQEVCLKAVPQSIDRIDRQAAVVYPIILADRLAIILSLPQQPLQSYIIPVSAKTLETTVAQFRYNLVIRSKRDFYQPARQLYQWLIRPLEADLDKNSIKTLVFVLDGVLRNVPMAALYDGQQYAIEKYAIAMTPGLQLLNPQQLQQTGLATLAVGLTEARAGFPPLYYVREELTTIKENVKGDILLNEAFTTEALREKIQTSSFPIVHIATHGQFSSNFEKTFILTWDSRIDIRQLDRLLKGRTQAGETAIELLVLSACETASGDRRAALGLAGMAVRSGARSTLATLWSVNDEATSEFMDRFYGSLATNKLTKAATLREAQIALLKEEKFKHPFYWSSYVLIGNWL